MGKEIWKTTTKLTKDHAAGDTAFEQTEILQNVDFRSLQDTAIDEFALKHTTHGPKFPVYWDASDNYMGASDHGELMGSGGTFDPVLLESGFLQWTEATAWYNDTDYDLMLQPSVILTQDIQHIEDNAKYSLIVAFKDEAPINELEGFIDVTFSTVDPDNGDEASCDVYWEPNQPNSASAGITTSYTTINPNEDGVGRVNLRTLKIPERALELPQRIHLGWSQAITGPQNIIKSVSMIFTGSLYGNDEDSAWWEEIYQPTS